MRKIKKISRSGRPILGHLAEASKIISIRFKLSYCEMLDELLYYYEHFMREKISRSHLFEIILKSEYQKVLHNKFNVMGLDIMICKRCEQNGVKSTIEVITSKNLLDSKQFYDENGQFHIHDPFAFNAEYHCSKGHQWSSENKKYECWCGWNKEG